MFKKSRPTVDEVFARAHAHVKTHGLPEGPPHLRQFQTPSKSCQQWELLKYGSLMVFAVLFGLAYVAGMVFCLIYSHGVISDSIDSAAISWLLAIGATIVVSKLVSIPCIFAYRFLPKL